MQNIEEHMSGLASEVTLLTSEIEVLKTKIDRLAAEHATLTAEIKALREENVKLQDKLGLTSKNSSIPSSKELYFCNPSTRIIS